MDKVSVVVSNRNHSSEYWGQFAHFNLIPVLDEFEEIFKMFYKEILADFKRKGKIVHDHHDLEEKEFDKELKRGKVNEEEPKQEEIIE